MNTDHDLKTPDDSILDYIITEIHSICDSGDLWFLALPLDAQNLTYQSNLQLLQKTNLLKVDDMKTKLVVVGSAWGPAPAGLNRCSMLDTMFVFALGFVCNGPELKLQFVFWNF